MARFDPVPLDPYVYVYRYYDHRRHAAKKEQKTMGASEKVCPSVQLLFCLSFCELTCFGCVTVLASPSKISLLSLLYLLSISCVLFLFLRPPPPLPPLLNPPLSLSLSTGFEIS